MDLQDRDYRNLTSEGTSCDGTPIEFKRDCSSLDFNKDWYLKGWYLTRKGTSCDGTSLDLKVIVPWWFLNKG